MSSTPPIARLSTSLVLGAVCPTYWPTRSSRVTLTSWPLRRYPSSRSISPMCMATVLLSVPRPEPVDQQQRGDLADPGLDRGQPDELPVELIQHRREPLGLLLLTQLHG